MKYYNNDIIHVPRSYVPLVHIIYENKNFSVFAGDYREKRDETQVREI